MKSIAVLVEEGYEDLEFWYPKLRLEEAGHDVFSLGRKDMKYRSKHGYPAKPDRTVDEVDPLDLDGVIVPGGRKCPDLLRADEKVLELVSKVYERGDAVGAICHGPWVMASAGVLEGETVTCYHAIRDDVVNAGADYRDRDVVSSGKLVTSRKPSDLPAFMAKFLNRLS